MNLFSLKYALGWTPGSVQSSPHMGRQCHETSVLFFFRIRIQRYARFLWYFSCFLFIGLPYYYVLYFLQTSEYTYVCRTPSMNELSDGIDPPDIHDDHFPSFPKRLRRWAKVYWRREQTISVAIFVSVLVPFLAWLIHRFL
ncbi:hypothetical protein BDN72DRAFT_286127 [Pluteus cervinus]|uniref:Uncharacterized protein n=1 Tax=Pluteus cervinus TaxID=181527 RepID=A0ACD3AEU2_9AGAR|nr:hypothetical protein BDN72DRAFT_286127 [Pluteus cervinus]